MNIQQNTDCGYKAFYKGKTMEVYARNMREAQLKAAGVFKAKKPWDVSVVLCERADGSEVVHAPTF